MPIYKAVWEFSSTSALPEDRINWTTHFEAANDLTAGLAMVPMIAFVNTPPAGVGGDFLAEWLSNSLATFATKIYRVGAPQGTPPIASTAGNVPGARNNVNDLPGDIAVCLSFKDEAVGVSADPQGMGRMFIGPFNTSAIDGSNRPGLVAQDMINVMRDAAKDLYDEWTLLGIEWGVYSRVGGVLHPVVSGWVDREPDYMGKRGLRTKVRTSWTF